MSDVYVRLGYEFNLACRAFNSIGVDTQDLGPVPDLLRTILEDTLSQPASPQALDNYLPRIRDIIINLLQGLKRKQSKLRTRPLKDLPSNTSVQAEQATSRSGSIASNVTGTTVVDRNGSIASNFTGTTLIDNGAVQPVERASGRRDSPIELDETNSTPSASSLPPPPAGLERRSSLRRSIRRDPQQTLPSSDSTSSMSSTTAQNLPVMSPQQPESNGISTTFPHAPPPPPKQDALTALQRGGDLERRASRRFSQYQIHKQLGASPNGIGVIPPSQNSPIPNRGRGGEARESMRAVQSRMSYQSTRQKSAGSKVNDASPSRAGTTKAINRISEERDDPPTLDTQNLPRIDLPPSDERIDSPTTKTPEEFKGALVHQSVTDPTPLLGATVSGPFSPSKEEPSLVVGQDFAATSPVRDTPPAKSARLEHRPSATPPPTTTVGLDSSPASTKELTLFLQYKTKVKKFVLPSGDDLTQARLQLAFIEKFAWTTHNNSVDLPEIYIQDPISGVRHELEDLADVKDRSVLVLNFEVLDEVKRHFDDGIGGLKNTLEGVRSLLDGQSTMMQRFAERQLDASKEMARISAAPTPRSTRTTAIEFDKSITPSRATEEQVQEVQNLRRDIAVLKQSYSSMSADFAASMNDIKAKAAHVKEAAKTAAVPSYEGSAGRAHVNEGKKQLGADSEALVNRVDNLSDTVEDLRKDVVSRGVRPRPRDLEVLSKEISSTVKDLQRVKEFMKREKPVWTKIWEQELNLVCTERDDLTQQEELMSDLFGDLEDVQNVFNLVEEAMKQQNLAGTGALRQSSKNIEIDPSVDPNEAKEGVLDEVRALRPNHEDRLEAIERAETQRRRELENRKLNEFQKEVEDFVETGRLKKTGGMDEVERVRKIRDKQAIRENWETQMKIEEEKARKRAEREAKKAAAAAQAEQPPHVNDVAGTAGESMAAAQIPVPGADGSHDTSLEGDAFQDAPTGMTPQPTPGPETENQPPLPISKDEPAEQRNSGPPQLPEVRVDGHHGM